MIQYAHKEKLEAALQNPKAKDDYPILQEALKAYSSWIKKMGKMKSEGDALLKDMISALNDYKDYLEVDLIAKKGIINYGS